MTELQSLTLSLPPSLFLSSSHPSYSCLLLKNQNCSRRKYLKVSKTDLNPFKKILDCQSEVQGKKENTMKLNMNLMTKTTLIFLAAKLKKETGTVIQLTNHSEVAKPTRSQFYIACFNDIFGYGIWCKSLMIRLNFSLYHYNFVHRFMHGTHTDTLPQRNKILRNGSSHQAECSPSLET